MAVDDDALAVEDGEADMHSTEYFYHHPSDDILVAHPKKEAQEDQQLLNPL